MSETFPPKLLTPEQVAELLGVTPHTLAVWRSSKRYPLPYIKCGRLVRYRLDDVQGFLQVNLYAASEPHTGTPP